MRGGDELRHGYTWADLRRMARAMTANPPAWQAAMDYDDRFEFFLSYFAERLYDAETPPEPGVLYRGALAEIRRHIDSDRSAHGSGPAFVKYWWWWEQKSAAGGPEEAVVDGVAVHQILDVMSDRLRGAFFALADTGTPADAADLLGIPVARYHTRLGQARKKFLELWHEGETPSRLWMMTRSGSYRGTMSNLRRRNRDSEGR